MNGSRGVVLACVWCTRARTSVYMTLMRGSWRHVGSTILPCISPATISAIIHLSVGDSDSFLLSPSITDVDLHRVTTVFNRIDSEIEEGVALKRTGNRPRWRRLTTIGDPARFGYRYRAHTSPTLSSPHSHPLQRSITASPFITSAQRG